MPTNEPTPYQPKEPEVEPKVTQVEGPYNDKGELLDCVELGETYYYDATLNVNTDKVKPNQVKWAVGYDTENYQTQYYLFSGKEAKNNKIRIGISIGNSKNIKEKIEETFKIYAYTDTPVDSTSVCVNALKLPLFLDKYKKAGYNIPGTYLADDLHYGDGIHLNTGHSKYSIKEIEELSVLFKVQLNQDDAFLWQLLNSMATILFSIGELETIAKKMIQHFKSSSGKEFTDPILTKHIQNHDSAQRFCASMEKLIVDRLKNHNSDITKISYKNYNNGDDTPRTKDADWGHPRFNTLKDNFLGGLTICMNDTWAYEVLITKATKKENRWNITYKVRLYDHFGLDKPDVKKIYRHLAGFRACFVLQHVRNYKPFITKVEFDKNFEFTL